MAGETVAVLVSDDDARDGQQSSIATPPAFDAAVNFNSFE